MYIRNGSATLSETPVISNSASYGGGVYITGHSATLNASGGRIARNTASNGGGGVYISGDSATLDGMQVLSNTASHGGGVYVSGDNAALNEVQVLSNTANYGGGVYITGGSKALTTSGGRIARNTAIDDGGGVFVASGNTTLNKTQVFSNVASHGGGVYVFFYGSATLSKTQVLNNAASYGGGVYVGSGATLDVSEGKITRNTAANNGGGVYINSGSTTLTATQIADNIAPNGSALYTEGTITSMSALTLTGDVYQANGHFAGSNHDLRIEGALVLTGGDFYAPDEPNTLTLTGLYTHTGGTYYQTQIVDGDSAIGFPKEGGLFVNANNINLGSTQVADTAGDDCAGVVSGEAVHHCFTITPSNIWGNITATLTFYYQNAEAHPGHDCSAMEVYAWDGTWDTLLTRDGSYGNDGRMCDNDPQSIRVIDVTEFPTFTLRGLAPEIDVTPLALDFGEQPVDGGPTLSQMVTVTNQGLADLHISDITLSGVDAAEFAITEGGEAITLTANQTHTVHIAFDPESIGLKTAMLSLPSNDIDEPDVTVVLSGTGTTTTFPLTVSKAGTGDGTVSSTPAGIDCGAACQADFVAGTVVTLTTATETGFIFAGWQGEGCNGTGVCQVTMDAAKHVTATFNVAPGYPGYGSTPAPGSSINIGVTDVGNTISTTLAIFETGDMPLIVTPTLGGADAGDFNVMPLTLNIPDGGAAQMLTLTCTPSIIGTRAATLTVTHNTLSSPALYPLRCTGGSPHFIYLPLVLKEG